MKHQIKVNHQPSGGKEWVAKITGTHPKYKMNREFIGFSSADWSGSGKTGKTIFELEDGLFQVNEPWKGKYFLLVENGEGRRINYPEALEIAKKMEVEA